MQQQQQQIKQQQYTLIYMLPLGFFPNGHIRHMLLSNYKYRSIKTQKMWCSTSKGGDFVLLWAFLDIDEIIQKMIKKTISIFNPFFF